jgi:hypothetical protein
LIDVSLPHFVLFYSDILSVDIFTFQVLERAFHQCDNDLDAAIMRLKELCLGAVGGNSGAAEEPEVVVNVGEGMVDIPIKCLVN